MAGTQAARTLPPSPPPRPGNSGYARRKSTLPNR